MSDPNWLNNSNQNSSDGASPAAAEEGSSESPLKVYLKYGTYILDLGLMIFMAATGAIGIRNTNDINNTDVVFVGLYMILFAAILTIFQLSQICGIKSFDTAFKKNFGFLYGINGKGLFTVFIGALCFGLSDPKNLAIPCGIIVASWGAIQIALYALRPQYFDKLEKYVPQ